jgi:hypothetical protein
VVMIRPDFAPHTDLVCVFISAVCHTRLDKECPRDVFPALDSKVPPTP